MALDAHHHHLISVHISGINTTHAVQNYAFHISTLLVAPGGGTYHGDAPNEELGILQNTGSLHEHLCLGTSVCRFCMPI